MCTFNVIQQIPTNCVLVNDDGTCIFQHINLDLSMRQGTHSHSPGHGGRTWILQNCTRCISGQTSSCALSMMDVEGMDEDMVTWVRAIEALQTKCSVFIVIAHKEDLCSFSPSPHTCALCLMFSLDPSVVGLAPPCTFWRKDTITRLCASHTCVKWSAKSSSFFPSCISSFLSLV